MAHSTIQVSAGLIFRSGRLLITKRKVGTHLEGLWEFPGGKREPGETGARCLRRELREELGIEVRVGQLFESITHNYPERSVRLEFYLCEILTGEAQPLDCAELKWVTQDELRAHAFPPADAQLLKQLEARSELWLRPS